MNITRTGRFLEVDNFGNIISDVSESCLTDDWRCLIHSVVDQVQKTDILKSASLYLRGSVPRGLAIRGISDIDFVLIADGKQQDLFHNRMHAIALSCLSKQNVCSGIECEVYKSTALAPINSEKLPILHKVLKTGGLYLIGKDYMNDLRPVRLEEMGDIYSRTMYRDFERCREILSLASSETPQALGWFARRLLRGAFEIISLLRINKYTRDIYLCWEAISLCEPSCEEVFWRVLELAVNPAEYNLNDGVRRLEAALFCTANYTGRN